MVCVGLAVFLAMFRLLKLFHFQARMGVLTRTLHRASVDLMHFFFIFVLLSAMYAALGTALFGHQIDEFVSVSSSLQLLMHIVVTGEGGALNQMA